MPTCLALQRRVADPCDAAAPSSQDTAPDVARLHETCGNGDIGSALAGPSDAWSADVAWRVEASVAGVLQDGSSNQAVLRAMRTGGGPAGAVAVATGGGQELPEAVRGRLEQAFGHEFSHVRVHTDPSAARASEALNARAFALGADLFFGAGEYAPGSAAGDRLLAHELTHVVQHDQGRLAGQQGVSSPSDPLEREAYANEDRILSRLSTGAEAGAFEAAASSLGAGMFLREEVPDEGVSLDWSVEQAVEEAWSGVIEPEVTCPTVADSDIPEVVFEQAPVPEVAPPTPPTLPQPASLRVEMAEVSVDVGDAVGAFADVTFPEPPAVGAFSPVVPELASAWHAYVDDALGVRALLVAGATEAAVRLSDAAATAASQSVAHVQGLRAAAATAMDKARTDVREAAQGARDELSIRYAAWFPQIGELATAHSAAVLDRVDTQVNDLHAVGAVLAADARRLGSEAADEVGRHLQTRADMALAAANALADQYGDHVLAKDIREACLAIAKRDVSWLERRANTAAEFLPYRAERVARQIERDTSAYERRLANEGLAVEAFWQDAVAAAEQELVEMQEPPLEQIDSLERDAIEALDSVEASLDGQLDGVQQDLVVGVERAACAAVEAHVLDVHAYVAVLDDQLVEMNDRIEAGHPSQWPSLLEAVETVHASLPPCESHDGLDEVVTGVLALPDAAAEQCALSLADLTGRLEEVVTNLSVGALGEIAGTDSQTGDLLAELDTQWGQIARDQSERADAYVSGPEGLQSVFDDGMSGREGVLTKRDGYIAVIDEAFDTANADLAEKAAALAGRPQQADWMRGLEGAWSGFWSATWTNIKVLLVVAAVVAAVVLIAALVIPGGASVLAAFAANWAAVLITVGAVLTVIAILLAVEQILGGMFDPTLSSFERGELIGGGVANIGFELVPDMLVDASVVKALAKGTDSVSAPAQAMRGLDDAVGVAASPDGVRSAGAAARQVSEAAGPHDGLADLASQAQRLGDDLDGTADGLDAAASGRAAMDDIGTPDEVQAAARRTMDGPPAVAPEEIASLRRQIDEVVDAMGDTQGSWDEAATRLSAVEDDLARATRSAEEAISYAQRDLALAESSLATFEGAVAASARTLDEAEQAFDAVPNGQIGELRAAWYEVSDARALHLANVRELAASQTRVAEARHALDGIVADRDLTLGTLAGRLSQAQGLLDGIGETMALHRGTRDRLEGVMRAYLSKADEVVQAPPPAPNITPPELWTWNQEYDSAMRGYWQEAYGSAEPAFDSAPVAALSYLATKDVAATGYQVAEGVVGEAQDHLSMMEQLMGETEADLAERAPAAAAIDEALDSCPP